MIIIVEGFEQKEYEQAKLTFVKGMIEKSEKQDFEWNRDYNMLRKLSVVCL